jgi:predicted nucleic acid-binding protein
LILVDTNVLVDIINDDPLWAEWSQREVTRAALREELAINDIIYAELSVRYETIEALDEMLREVELTSVAIARHALFLAGKAFQLYRLAGGTKTGVLPDFFIGAHAVVSDSMLITRDPGRYRTYFPGIALIAPN